MIERLRNMQASKGQFSDGGKLFEACRSNSELRSEIEALSKTFLKRGVHGCQNCYMDAYFELININIEKAMNVLKCQFVLLVGALLHDVINYDNDLLCSNANITDDLALYHLKTNPSCIKFFEKYPEDLEAQVKSFVIPGTEPEMTEEQKAEAAEAIKLQEKTEVLFVAELQELLKAGTKKVDIKETYKEVEKVGEVKLTQRFLAELIKRAEQVEA